MLPVIIKRRFSPYYRDDFFGSDKLSAFFSDGADYTVPAANIKENEKYFAIEVAAPGLNKEDFKVKLEKNILTVSSEKETQNKEEKENFIKNEFSYKSFCRSFSIPETIDTEKIKASHKNGILTIELPKLNEVKNNHNKKIEIS
jgi:HSP20 family protein